jgi:uncharacterized protein (TIGR00725 family)
MSPTERQLYVAVCGAGVANDRDTPMAEAVGRLLARAGAIVVSGGLGGVMAAAVRGASIEGGLSIGLLPGETRAGAADGLTVALPTGLGEGRNILVVRAADALIAVGGEFGTLTEIAFALKIGVPVIGLDTWELAKEGKRVEAFPTATTPEAAVDLALEAARRSRQEE